MRTTTVLIGLGRFTPGNSVINARNVSTFKQVAASNTKGYKSIGSAQ
jgi:hypothetical protein